jgi:hypothetical protein
MQAFVVIHRPAGHSGAFVIYVTRAATKEDAIRAVRQVESEGDFEINGKPLSVVTAKSLALSTGEVRRLWGVRLRKQYRQAASGRHVAPIAKVGALYGNKPAGVWLRDHDNAQVVRKGPQHFSGRESFRCTDSRDDRGIVPRSRPASEDDP